MAKISSFPEVTPQAGDKFVVARAGLNKSVDATGVWSYVQAAIYAATAKTTPIDADLLTILDSAASYVAKKLTWANLKATLKTYFDTLYVLKSLFDANTILAANTDNTPAAVTVAEQRLVGRITAGNITALTAAQVLTLLGFYDQAWVPTWTNLTIGSGTVTARYIEAADMVIAYIKVALAADSSISGAVSFTLPAAPGGDAAAVLGFATLRDTGVAQYSAVCYKNAGGDCEIRVNKSDATYVTQAALSATVPFTWGNADEIHVNLTYIK